VVDGHARAAKDRARVTLKSMGARVHGQKCVGQRSPQERSHASRKKRSHASGHSSSGGSIAANTIRRSVMCPLIRALLDELACLVVADGQIRHLEAAPTSLALGKGKVARTANNLANSRMTEQVRVNRCGLASRSMP
jgi:hypothetical protein